jgi:hypothetical protein
MSEPPDAQVVARTARELESIPSTKDPKDPEELKVALRRIGVPEWEAPIVARAILAGEEVGL